MIDEPTLMLVGYVVGILVGFMNGYHWKGKKKDE